MVINLQRMQQKISELNDAIGTEFALEPIAGSNPPLIAINEKKKILFAGTPRECNLCLIMMAKTAERCMQLVNTKLDKITEETQEIKAPCYDIIRSNR
jgi:hypothetical protein